MGIRRDDRRRRAATIRPISTPTSSFVARSTQPTAEAIEGVQARSSASTWGSSGTPGTSSRTTPAGRTRPDTRGARIGGTRRGRSIERTGSPVATRTSTGASRPRSCRRPPGPSSRSTSIGSWSISRRHVAAGDTDPYEATYAILNGSRILRALETRRRRDLQAGGRPLGPRASPGPMAPGPPCRRPRLRQPGIVGGHRSARARDGPVRRDGPRTPGPRRSTSR